MKILLPLFVTAVAFGQEAPKISDAHLSEYYRADGQLLRAQLAVKEAQEDAQRASADVVKDCGDKFFPGQDPRDPKKIVCVAKPTEKK